MVDEIALPRIESLTITNYRALRNVTLSDLQPISAFVGPNGSGKSTLLDVFAFLSECFTVGLRQAVDNRGRFRELRSRNADGPIAFEIRYRESPIYPSIVYHLAINEDQQGPYVAAEWMAGHKREGPLFRFLDFASGEGTVIGGDFPSADDKRSEEKFGSRDVLAVNTLGQFARNPRVAALRRFIVGWYLSYLTVDDARGFPFVGPQHRLSKTGDNLANVVQYLKENHPARLQQIENILAKRAQPFQAIEAEIMPDGRLLLQMKEHPFEKPILARFASDGTLKWLAYLTLLYDPTPPPVIGIEEPENHLYPHLLGDLASECRRAAAHSQFFITTHAPYFTNEFRLEEVWLFSRGGDGYTQAQRGDTVEGAKAFIREGGKIGDLWMEGLLRANRPIIG